MDPRAPHVLEFHSRRAASLTALPVNRYNAGGRTDFAWWKLNLESVSSNPQALYPADLIPGSPTGRYFEEKRLQVRAWRFELKISPQKIGPATCVKKKMKKMNKMYTCCVCCFVLLNRYWGINESSRGFFTSEPREYVPTIENRRRTNSPWPPLDNLGWPDPHPSP